MLPNILVRRARSEEIDLIHSLVQTIANETFAELFPVGVPIGDANWHSAWVALSGGEIVGVSMTQDEWLSDLWVRDDSRRLGIGAALLGQAESEMANRGSSTFQLRVVKSNTRAVRFYETHGWIVHREFPHEKFRHAMYEMRKHLANTPALTCRICSAFSGEPCKPVNLFLTHPETDKPSSSFASSGFVAL
jgi:ribosomal protein S18 acetylase RimI-like enzyme